MSSAKSYLERRRARVVRAIWELSAELGHSPSQVEIAARCGEARGTVRDDLYRLSEAGRVRLTPGARRTIVLLEEAS